jgi:hypothetical protein
VSSTYQVLFQSSLGPVGSARCTYKHVEEYKRCLVSYRGAKRSAGIGGEGRSTEGKKPLACKGVACPVLIHVERRGCTEAVSVHIPGVHNGKAQAWQRHESCTYSARAILNRPYVRNLCVSQPPAVLA